MRMSNFSKTKFKSQPVLIRKMDYGNSICTYTHRICLQNKLEGCDHFIRHILYDKNSLFKQCSFVHPQSHKRCPNAARKTDRKESVCPWHLKKIFIKRKQLQNAMAEKSLGKMTPTQQLFRDLEHYCPTEHDKNRLNSNWIKQEDDKNTDDEDLTDPTDSLVENTFRADAINSDSESIDSDQDDPLKNAGVYTPEEVSSILRDKMVKLQGCYMSELNHLQHLLKEKYKRYINNVRNQQDVFQFSPFKLTMNGSQPPDDYNKLKTMMRYHRYHGAETLLRQQFKEKLNELDNENQTKEKPTDATASSSNSKSKTSQQCIYEKDKKCERKAMPLTHYCKIHILYDVDQVLFRPCAAGNPPCLNPVMSYQKGNACILHEDQKEIKDFCVLEDDEYANTDKVEEASLAAPTNNFMDVDETVSLGIDSVDTGPLQLFGLDQFNQLDR